MIMCNTVMATRNNTTISVCKALAIIGMVIGHADPPYKLLAFIYLWHMPLFFIASGYFFKKSYLTDELTFIKKRIKALYVPCVKWSLIILLLNPLFFWTGFLNEQYGNPDGGVTHPLNLRQGIQHAVGIIFTMSNYDVFLLSAFWFFRALLVGSIAYLVIFKLLTKIPFFRKHENICLLTICAICMLLAVLKYGHFKIRYWFIAQGGYRDIMCVFFMSIGYLFRKYERFVSGRYWLMLPMFAILLWYTFNLHTSLTLTTKLHKVIWQPYSAIAGFIFIYLLAQLIEKTQSYSWGKTINRFLVFCGNNTIKIMIFHIFAYKVIALLQIAIYDLEWKQIGCHMVIHHPTTSQYWWVFYSIGGVAIPLFGTYLSQKIRCKSSSL